jgi:hypothetical protein
VWACLAAMGWFTLSLSHQYEQLENVVLMTLEEDDYTMKAWTSGYLNADI